MKLIKGMVSLVAFIVNRPYQITQIRFERFLYKYKYFRTMAGYE